MLGMACDPVVRGRAAISRAVRAARRAADVTDGRIAIGLKPRYPSTGRGYLHASRPGPAGTRRVQQFLEKPDLKTATRFLKSGGYYWNVAWFAWRTSVFLAEMQMYAPRHQAGLRKVVEARAAGNEDLASEPYRRVAAHGLDGGGL